MPNNGYEKLHWGRLDYQKSLEKMRQRHAARVAGKVGDAIILVEHPRVFTLGTGGGRDNILLSDEEMAQKGFACHEVERVGNATYHGPGQVMAYPVINVKKRRIRARALVAAVEQAILQVSASFGVKGELLKNKPGLWVAGAKLAAIGMAIINKVTMHGLALNVNTRLQDFGYIKACGLEEENTSLKKELGRELDMQEVQIRLFDALVGHLGQAEKSLVVNSAAH